ncbi:hypothetical protein SAMN05421641_103202 [Paracoccus thiocyanatus]|uniref:DUF465 domain-containing protein n=1 Tax=Paracoccus thiocyanatus TaxID=34006 RepID=A0A1N6PWU0_9RHOB|nr:DUF465 domain-containing protein [Paracoccus thiocyanatus]SIQ08801.1 hypothetical protein SAMN05421641_103202 [Paracoccus thiocyanatus]
MAAPHAIHEEFPQDTALIHELKVSNTRFARLLEEYDAVNDEVAAAESRHVPMSQEAETDLRKKRAALKDEIARMLGAAQS